MIGAGPGFGKGEEKSLVDGGRLSRIGCDGDGESPESDGESPESDCEGSLPSP